MTYCYCKEEGCEGEFDSPNIEQLLENEAWQCSQCGAIREFIEDPDRLIIELLLDRIGDLEETVASLNYSFKNISDRVYNLDGVSE